MSGGVWDFGYEKAQKKQCMVIVYAVVRILAVCHFSAGSYLCEWLKDGRYYTHSEESVPQEYIDEPGIFQIILANNGKIATGAIM